MLSNEQKEIETLLKMLSNKTNQNIRGAMKKAYENAEKQYRQYQQLNPQQKAAFKKEQVQAMQNHLQKNNMNADEGKLGKAFDAMEGLFNSLFGNDKNDLEKRLKNKEIYQPEQKQLIKKCLDTLNEATSPNKKVVRADAAATAGSENERMRILMRQYSQPPGMIPFPVWNYWASPNLCNGFMDHFGSAMTSVLESAADASRDQNETNLEIRADLKNAAEKKAGDLKQNRELNNNQEPELQKDNEFHPTPKPYKS